MQRYGNQDPVGKVGIEPRVIEPGFKESPELMGKVDFPTVFKIVQQGPTLIPASQGGTGEFKIEFEVMAVRADEIS